MMSSRFTDGAKHWIVLVSVAILLAASSLSDAQQRPRYAGRRVVDVLGQLQAPGTKIIFSSKLVTPAMRVQHEPKAQTRRQLLIEILAPHGLHVEDGPAGTLLVVSIRQPHPATTQPASPTPAAPARATTTTGRSPVERSSPVYRRERVDVSGQIPVRFSAPPLFVAPERVTKTAGAFDNLLQAVQTLPGVVGLSDQDSRISVRGARPDHNLILLDGVPIHDPFRVGPFSWATSLFDPATIERVEVDPSGLDAALGGRLSSAIIVETRDGTTTRQLEGTATVGLTDARVAVEGRLPRTRSGSWLLSTRGAYHDALLSMLKRRTGLPSFYDVQLKTSLYPTRRSRLSLLTLAGRSTLRGEFPDEEEVGHSSMGIVGTTWHWTPNDRVKLEAAASGYWQQVRNLGVDRDSARVVFDRRIDIADVATRQRVTVRAGSRHVLDGGLELRRLQTGWAMQGGVGPYWLQTPGPTVWGQQLIGRVDSRLSSTRVAVWIQDRVELTPDLELQPGLRIDWNSYTDEATPQPRLRIGKQLDEHTRMWAGVGWQAQTPGHESMLQGVSFFDFEADNRNALRNERMRQFTVGVERRLTPSTMFRGEVYHRTFDRLLVQQLETAEERARRLAPYDIPPDLPVDSALLEDRASARPASTGHGRAFGVEFLLERRARSADDRVSGAIAYAFNKAVRDAYGRMVPFDGNRLHMLTFLASWRLTRSMELSATWLLGWGLPVTPAALEVAFVPDYPDGDGDGDRTDLRAARHADGSFVKQPTFSLPRVSLLNSARLPLYSRVDVRWTYQPPDARLSYYGEVINVFNRKNFTKQGEGHGRLPNASMRLTF